MNIPQYILTGLVVLTTWGGFVEATAYRGYKLTLGRFLLAMVVPLLWIALIVLPSWDYILPNLGLKLSWWLEIILGILFMVISAILMVLLVAGAPAFLVMTVVIWVGAALTGDTKTLVDVLKWRPGKRRVHDPTPPDTQYGQKLSRRK